MRRLIFNEYEQIVSEDLNDFQLATFETIQDKLLRPFFNQQDGFLASSFRPTKTSDTSISLAPGCGFFYDIGVSNGPQYRMIMSRVGIDINFDLPVTHPRFDLVAIRPLDIVAETASRWVKQGGTGPIAQQTVDKIMESIYEIDVIEGVEDVSPVPPALPAGWLSVGWIYMTSSEIDAIHDNRKILYPYGVPNSNVNRITDAGETVVPNGVPGVYLMDATAGAQTVRLPTAPQDGMEIFVKKIDNSANTVTIVADIDGAVNSVIEHQYTGRTMIASNFNWFFKG